MRRIATAPGRVNLIGDHTDYTSGLVLPMAIPLRTTVEVEVGGDRIELRSADDPDVVDLPLPSPSASRCLLDGVEPVWGRIVAAVAAELGPSTGIRGTVTTSLPIGAGLSSSAALEVAVALALGHPPAARRDRALLCQRAERAATGVPCGIMDQLVVCEAEAGSALLIDCRTLATSPVALPAGVAVHAVHSGVARSLAGSAYADRRASCEDAESRIGPLRDASLADVAGLPDGLRRRARHVVTENARVEAFAAALAAGDPVAAGALMDESHHSLARDYEVSVPALDRLCERLRAVPGVYGARLTGAGFGGCVVALVDRDVSPEAVGGWRLAPVAGAGVREEP
jgi:galactokinase